MAFTQMSNILREGDGILALVVETSITNHDKSAQETHHMFDPPFAKQIISNTEKRMNKVAGTQQESEPCSVHDNITMVGYKERTMTDIPLNLFLIAVVLQLDSFRGLAAHD
jgi:hypothetical protein